MIERKPFQADELDEEELDEDELDEEELDEEELEGGSELDDVSIECFLW